MSNVRERTPAGLTPTAQRAYLERIGVEAVPAPTDDALHDLHLAHLYHVPFENLSIHLDEPIVLDTDALVDKVVHQRRGGFCYELNGAFAALLESLGFAVERLAARVVNDQGELGPLFDHMALRVRVPGAGTVWLADVGFGRSFLRPLRFDDREPQADAGGTFHLVEAAGTHVVNDLDLYHDKKRVFRLEQRTRTLDDFGPTCWYQQTNPASHFTRGATCSLLLRDGGRVTIAERLLIETAEDGTRTETTLTDAEALDAYRTHFGIDLDRVPAARHG